MLMLLQIITLLLIFGCNQQKATSEDPKKEETKTEKPAEAEQNSDKCAINMARLAILVQEYAAIGGTMTVDDDVDCPTDQQLQEMRDGIAAGKKHVADEKLRQAQEDADREEERAREWVGYRRPIAVTFKIGEKCYLCESGDLSFCRQEEPKDLPEVSCTGR